MPRLLSTALVSSKVVEKRGAADPSVGRGFHFQRKQGCRNLRASRGALKHWDNVPVTQRRGRSSRRRRNYRLRSLRGNLEQQGFRKKLLAWT